tara:strand:- start:416 stop:622 length:207 start_codon:yes stop_codon:yes gene_type:complete
MNLLPKSFPNTKAKISVNTEINNAVKKKLLPYGLAIKKVKEKFMRIKIKINQTNMLLFPFILKSSNKE